MRRHAATRLIPQLCRTEIVRVVRLRVAVTARGERPLTLAVLTDLACTTETIRVRRRGVAVTAPGETPALNTLSPRTAGGVGLLSTRVTVTARGERWLTGAVLQGYNKTHHILSYYEVPEKGQNPGFPK